ncbi:hypothetical protein [Acidianus brierleyi]|uniref:hypothetical protein n=1 Tax=Acidianus brierleyi TaxID=41673 RepID=UPI0013A5AEC2|nr:hypothetical protein [Acidianus brierleyi]
MYTSFFFTAFKSEKPGNDVILLDSGVQESGRLHPWRWIGYTCFASNMARR